MAETAAFWEVEPDGPHWVLDLGGQSGWAGNQPPPNEDQSLAKTCLMHF